MMNEGLERCKLRRAGPAFRGVDKGRSHSGAYFRNDKYLWLFDPGNYKIQLRLIFAVVSSTPLHSVTCLHHSASFSAYFNTKEHK